MELAKAVKKARRVFIAGNGGSAANAMHIANDLISCGVKAQALTADVATLTAIANDYGYVNVFSRQLEVLAEAEDLLIVLSGSGKSPNIHAALGAAKAIGMNTWALFGAYSDASAPMADCITRAGADMQAAEDAQVQIGHDVLRWLKSS